MALTQKNHQIPSGLPATSRQETTWQMPRQQKLKFGRSPQTDATVASYCEGDSCLYVPLTIKWQCGGIFHVLALMITGAEVTEIT